MRSVHRVSILFFISACSTTATISRSDGTNVEARIVGGTKTDLYVESNVGPMRVPKSAITDIDHPGNVLGTIGAALTAYGVLNLIVGVPICQNPQSHGIPLDQQGSFCVGMLGPLVAGLALTSWGFSTWARSRSAVDSLPDTAFLSRLPPSPPALIASPAVAPPNRRPDAAVGPSDAGAALPPANIETPNAELKRRPVRPADTQDKPVPEN